MYSNQCWFSLAVSGLGPDAVGVVLTEEELAARVVEALDGTRRAGVELHAVGGGAPAGRAPDLQSLQRSTEHDAAHLSGQNVEGLGGGGAAVGEGQPDRVCARPSKLDIHCGQEMIE